MTWVNMPSSRILMWYFPESSLKVTPSSVTEMTESSGRTDMASTSLPSGITAICGLSSPSV